MFKINNLGLQPYIEIWEQMQKFTAMRDHNTTDELWLLEHPAVYTQGQAGKSQHILAPSTIYSQQLGFRQDASERGEGMYAEYMTEAERACNSAENSSAKSIPIVQSDRGGQVTYHGPGQLIGYILMDLHRKKMGIKSLVCRLETVLSALLATYNIKPNTQANAPGVYVGAAKIASIGLRVKNGCTYHGIALNVAMDLTPFTKINPCGFANLEMTQISHYKKDVTMADVRSKFTELFLHHFAYDLAS